MCHLRAHRHSCGHTVSRPVSACRFTYLSPNSTERPLCHPSPELTVNVETSCRQCQYHVFCQRWESRLGDARSKQTAARMLLREVLQEEDDWAAGEWSSPSNDNEHAIEEPRGRSQSDWGMGSLSPTDDTFGWGGFNGGGPSDSNAIRRERERADREVDSLWTQYQREQWTAWKYFVTGPSMDSESANRRSVRRRKTQVRLSGPTRLSSVTSIDDLPDVIPEVPNYEDEWNCRDVIHSPGSDLSSAESEGSDQGGISSSVAAKNIRSDVSSDWKTWSWPQASGSGSLPMPPNREDLINPSGRVSPPSPTSTSPPPLSPTGSIGSSPLSSSPMSSWDDDEEDNRGGFSMTRTYKPRDDTGIAMMELGAIEANSGASQEDDWLPAWGA